MSEKEKGKPAAGGLFIGNKFIVLYINKVYYVAKQK